MNKATKAMITILFIILVAGIATLLFILNEKNETHAYGDKTIEEMVEVSFETEPITTDLKDGNYVRVTFTIVTDNKDTKKILEQDFRLKNVIIKELATKEEEDFREGLEALEKSLKSKINGLLSEGEVTDVFTTNKVLQ